MNSQTIFSPRIMPNYRGSGRILVSTVSLNENTGCKLGVNVGTRATYLQYRRQLWGCVAEALQEQQDIGVCRFGELVKEVPPPDTLTPADSCQVLFVAVQIEEVFKGSKTFIDFCGWWGEKSPAAQSKKHTQ